MKPKFVTIGLVQSRVSSDMAANVAKTESLIRRAAARGAQIICLQELFQTPYFPQRRHEAKDSYAETVPGPTSRRLQALAKSLKIVLIVPLYEKMGRHYLNTAAVFGADGKMLGKYHKIHIPHDPGFYEKDYFEEGSEGYKIFNTPWGKFAVLICFDQWFPEAARAARLAGAEIIFYPTAVGEILGYKTEGDWHDAWETIQRGHAIANSLYVCTVNRTGREGRMKFFGQSFVADPFGKILKRAAKDREEVLVQKLDLSRNEFFAEGWGFLRNRRPDTYAALTGNKLVKKSKKLQNVAHYTAERRALGQ
ncbi:MAG TPA: carbon-nitrogen hydrolase [Patescibacteria group bacterium]|nr:carbon-nitrogen hydrolase [Patescibacteria group bacterium]